MKVAWEGGEVHNLSGLLYTLPWAGYTGIPGGGGAGGVTHPG